VANFSVASRKTWTLTSGQEDIVTLTAAGIRRIEVVNHDGTTRASANLNGAAVTADGDGSKPVLPGGVTVLYDANDEHRMVFPDGATIQVRVIATGTPTITVAAY
jgi:hypothetical protein